MSGFRSYLHLPVFSERLNATGPELAHVPAQAEDEHARQILSGSEPKRSQHSAARSAAASLRS